jgi:hypothetical protein
VSRLNNLNTYYGNNATFLQYGKCNIKKSLDKSKLFYYKYLEQTSSNLACCCTQTIVSTGTPSLKTIKVGIDITLN